MKYDNGADQTNLRKNEILNILIHVPSIEEQLRIVNILDRFDTLCTICPRAFRRKLRHAESSMNIIGISYYPLKNYRKSKEANTVPYFNIVAETSENTVVTEYEPVKKRSDSYQSEAALEQEFIRMLCEQGYEYLPIHTESDLVSNLRRQLEELNHYIFSDTEWEDFFHNAIANPNEHIVEKTRKIQEDHIQNLRRDDGSTKNITLIDKKISTITVCRSSISMWLVQKMGQSTTTGMMLQCWSTGSR